MTPCVESLTSVGKRIAEINRLLVPIARPMVAAGYFLHKPVCRVLRLPSELRLYFISVIAEKEARRGIETLRNALLQKACHSDDFARILEELRGIIFYTSKVLKQAYESDTPGYILTRMENHLHLWTDFAEDMEVAADPECRSMFDELAAELAKRQ